MYLSLIFGLLLQGNVQQIVPQWDLNKIVIRNVATNGIGDSFQVPRVNVGPSVGSMLLVHFFPGIDHYNAGRYLYAQAEFAYVLRNAQYLDANPRKNEFMSTTHLLTGMIYEHHAEGLGRRNVAREHFEAAIQWNPNNYMAYLELARVFAELRFTKHATMIIESLLQLSPPEAIAQQARDELSKLSSNDSNQTLSQR